MLVFNKKDENLPQIEQIIKIDGNLLRYNYRIYGLKNENNPSLLLEYNPNIVGISTDKFDFLTHLFNRNKIETSFEILNEEKDKIYIGLRRDLRDFPEFCVKLLQTIIYYLEGNLKIRKNSKIPKIPKLNKKVEEQKVAEIKIDDKSMIGREVMNPYIQREIIEEHIPF
mgnify:CR=1 FL=1